MQLSLESRQAVRTGSFILPVLAVLVGGSGLYVWHGILKPYTEGLERPRIPLLKKIAKVQKRFRDQDLDRDGRPNYGNSKDLFKAKLLTDREVHKAGLVFIEPATSNPKNRWWAVAQPLHSSQGRSFFINHTGAIYASNDTPGDLVSRVNRKSGEVPMGMHLVQ